MRGIERIRPGFRRTRWDRARRAMEVDPGPGSARDPGSTGSDGPGSGVRVEGAPDPGGSDRDAPGIR